MADICQNFERNITWTDPHYGYGDSGGNISPSSKVL